MDFSLNEEQRMLTDLVNRFIEREYAFENRRNLAQTAQGWSTEHWAALADTGLLALNVAEVYGGLGAGPAETMMVMEAFGRGLLLEPYLPTAVVGAALIGKSATDALKNDLLGELAAGSLRVALAALEPQARFDLSDVLTDAKRSNNGYVLNGQKAVVAHGDSADWLIVSARTSGQQRDRQGVSLFLVPATAAGVEIRGFSGLDGQRVAEIRLSDVHVNAEAVLGRVDLGFDDLDWAVDRGLFALCAEAVGCMARLTELTVDYLQTRKQFGKAIGSFQSLQHRLADMLGYVEQSRSITLYAASCLDGPALERRKAVSAAKALIGRAGRLIGQQAVQLHGGMGMTDELAVGWYFKRLTCIDMTWGDADHHVERYSELL
ncbi:acyl-CoA dehydrogenase family protein [Pseudomonas marginalis]|uniref:acyl-CoA dehydrogenase family protein n=1 Tax=Pseudomonas TaxID=286 RepID=UPI003899B8B5